MNEILFQNGHLDNGNIVYLTNLVKNIHNDEGIPLQKLLDDLAYVSDIEFKAGRENFPVRGNPNHLYIDLLTGSLYYWNETVSNYSRILAVDSEVITSSHSHDNMDILSAVKYALTNELKKQYDDAYTHSNQPHAPADAEKNVQSDWENGDSQSDAYIRNKPLLGTIAPHNTEEFATAAQGQKADTAVQKVCIGNAEQTKTDGTVYLPEITGAASTILYRDLPGHAVLVSDEYGKTAASAVSDSELSALKDIQGNVQEQLNSASQALQNEVQRASQSEAELSQNLTEEAGRAAAAEELLTEAVTAETKRAKDMEAVLTADLNTHSSDTANPHKVTKAQIGLGNVTNESKATLFTSPAFTGTPTAPSAPPDTNSSQIATAKFVQEAISRGIAASDALIFKGTLGEGGTVAALPATYRTGWTYRVISSGQFAGETCEPGDLITALVSRTGSGNLDTDWTVSQTNIDGAVVSTRKINAGNGLTGGGDLSYDRTIHVGAGNGITAAADSISVKPNTTGTAGSVGKTVVDGSGVGAALGTTSTTAFRGDQGKTAYDHSQAAHARTDATKVEPSTANGMIKINGAETKVYSLPQTATFGNGAGFTIEQEGGTYRQRLECIDNSTSGDSVFRFSQSSDSGATYRTLLDIRDDGSGYLGSGKIYHTGNKPSKSDVGLGNVPNVATNDQTVTYTQAASLGELATGEKLSAALGKLAKAVSTLIAHLSDTVKHISAEERAKWNTVTGKVDKVSGKQLSTNDYTAAEKSKLAGIAAGAEVNIQADWSVTDAASDAFVKNKPSKLSQFSNDAGFITSSDIDTSQNHTHSNKAVLDKISQSSLDNWNSTAAVAESAATTASNATTAASNAATAASNAATTASNAATVAGNAATVAGNALAKKGGTMTGNITYNMYASTRTPVKIYGGDVNGQGISVGDGGATIVGAGESAKACESLLPATTEQLWLTSDRDIKFYTNCNTIGDKAGVVLDAGRQFYPDANNTGSLGTAANQWNHVYAATFNGNLAGNASSAAKLAAARTVTLSGDVTGSFSFDGSKNVTAALKYAKLPSVDKILNGLTVSPSDFTNLTAKITNSYFTANSVVDVYFNESSIPIAQKAQIIVNSCAGYLELKAKKVPTGNLTLETVRILDKEVLTTLNGEQLLNGSTDLEGYSHTPVIQHKVVSAKN